MILGLAAHPYARCLAEINDAVESCMRERADDRIVCFNAHEFDAPPGTIIYNLENVPRQVNPERWRGHEVWDFSASNVAKYPRDMNVKHVPIGWHPSMRRFAPEKAKRIDVILTGALCPRRRAIMSELGNRAVSTIWLHGPPDEWRDDHLAHARLAINVRFYEDGLYPMLRAAHLAANGVPCISETSSEMPEWALHAPHDRLVDLICSTLKYADLDAIGEKQRTAFEATPLVLP